MGTTKLDPELHAELLASFTQFDRNGDGALDRTELAQIFEALDADMSPDEIAVGMSVIDRNENGLISFDEFVAWWTDR